MALLDLPCLVNSIQSDLTGRRSFNDGFGGNNTIQDNLLFNTCRESSDHGAFNSWDRLPYITDVATGKPSTIPGVNDVHNNFIVANYA